MGWRFSKKTDLHSIVGCLLAKEWHCIQILDLFLINGEFYFPDPSNIITLIEEKKGIITNVIVITSRGLVYPIFSHEIHNNIDSLQEVKSLIKGIFFRLHGVIGLKKDVVTFNTIINKQIRLINSYILMVKDQIPYKDLDKINLIRATLSDLDILVPLEIGYQKEEVLISPKDFNKGAIIQNLKNKITNNEYYYIASKNGIALTKGCITHKSLNYYLLGGIYTEKEYRNNGLSTILLKHLINDQLAKGFKPALFVKVNNQAAKKVYSKLNFKYPLEYAIYYYKR